MAESYFRQFGSFEEGEEFFGRIGLKVNHDGVVLPSRSMAGYPISKEALI